MSKEETIQKYNTIISEFMGLYVDYDNKQVTNGNLEYDFDKLLFHKDWNWLMTVIEKIRDIVKDKEQYSIERAKYNYIQIELLTLKINNIFIKIIDFIEWYNKQTKE